MSLQHRLTQDCIQLDITRVLASHGGGLSIPAQRRQRQSRSQPAEKIGLNKLTSSGFHRKRFLSELACDNTELTKAHIGLGGGKPQPNSGAVKCVGHKSVVGTSRCDVPARVQRAERMLDGLRTKERIAPLNAARTA